jgi:ABC-type phosphate transport system auxiliary subunit
MDARELTVVVNNLKDQAYEIEKQVSYLTQEFEKLRLLVSDLQIDVKMLNGGGRNG